MQNRLKGIKILGSKRVANYLNINEIIIRSGDPPPAKILILVTMQDASRGYRKSGIGIHDPWSRGPSITRSHHMIWLRGLQLINELSVKRVPVIQLWRCRATEISTTETWRLPRQFPNLMLVANQDHNSKHPEHPGLGKYFFVFRRNTNEKNLSPDFPPLVRCLHNQSVISIEIFENPFVIGGEGIESTGKYSAMSEIGRLGIRGKIEENVELYFGNFLEILEREYQKGIDMIWNMIIVPYSFQSWNIYVPEILINIFDIIYRENRLEFFLHIYIKENIINNNSIKNHFRTWISTFNHEIKLEFNSRCSYC